MTHCTFTHLATSVPSPGALTKVPLLLSQASAPAHPAPWPLLLLRHLTLSTIPSLSERLIPLSQLDSSHPPAPCNLLDWSFNSLVSFSVSSTRSPFSTQPCSAPVPQGPFLGCWPLSLWTFSLVTSSMATALMTIHW